MHLFCEFTRVCSGCKEIVITFYLVRPHDFVFKLKLFLKMVWIFFRIIWNQHEYWEYISNKFAYVLHLKIFERFIFSDAEIRHKYKI